MREQVRVQRGRDGFEFAGTDVPGRIRPRSSTRCPVCERAGWMLRSRSTPSSCSSSIAASGDRPVAASCAATRRRASSAIRGAGGEIFGITSEPQTLASEAGASWGLDFPLVGDPHHEIAGLCRERGWLDLYVNTAGDDRMLARHVDPPAHPKGYFQPGVLALARGPGCAARCRAAGHRILYRWRGVPTRHNNGGATERPTPGTSGSGSKRRSRRRARPTPRSTRPRRST